MDLDKKYVDKVLKIMELAVKKTVPGKRDIFVSFSAHVGELSVIIYKNGWDKKRKPDFINNYICLENETSVGKEYREILDKELKKIIKIIEKL